MDLANGKHSPIIGVFYDLFHALALRVQLFGGRGDLLASESGSLRDPPRGQEETNSSQYGHEWRGEHGNQFFHWRCLPVMA